MAASRIQYPIVDGFVDHWLVAGPRAVPVPDLEGLDGVERERLDLARRFRSPQLEIQEPPIELGTFQLDDTHYTWRYVRCGVDHVVDRSAIYPAAHHLTSWAYAELAVPGAQEAFGIANN